MQIKICAVGICKDRAILDIMNEYMKRLRWKIEIKEISPFFTPEEESKKLLKEAHNSFCIVLDEKGVQYDSIGFSRYIGNIMLSNSKISFLIGGANGHSDIIKKAKLPQMSLSIMTMPHMLARLFLVEQIYRAQSIVDGHPYHK